MTNNLSWCSAGVGRTGTLLALDYLIKQADVEHKVDVTRCVYELRQQRIHTVQTVVCDIVIYYFEHYGNEITHTWKRQISVCIPSTFQLACYDG